MVECLLILTTENPIRNLIKTINFFTTTLIKQKMPLTLHPNNLSFSNKVFRILWRVIWLLFFRPTPRYLHQWRCLLLRLFGAKIGHGVHPYPSANIWAPWNLTMKDNSCLSEHVDCYNVDKISIGKNSTVSQYSFLCTASHDYTKAEMPLITAEIIIEDDVWIMADVFIAPGVKIGEGSIVGARSSVFSNIPAWIICKGNPAIGYRVRNNPKLTKDQSTAALKHNEITKSI